MSFLAAYTRPSSVSEIVKVSKAIQYVGHILSTISFSRMLMPCNLQVNLLASNDQCRGHSHRLHPQPSFGRGG